MEEIPRKVWRSLADLVSEWNYGASYSNYSGLDFAEQFPARNWWKSDYWVERDRS